MRIDTEQAGWQVAQGDIGAPRLRAPSRWCAGGARLVGYRHRGGGLAGQ